MNFPIERQPPGKPPGSRQEAREMIEQAMAEVVMELIQHRRTLWLVVKEAGGKVVVDENKCHPLWQMKATRLADGRMELEARQLDDVAEEKLALLGEILEGAKTPLEIVMAQAGLQDYPPVYVEKCLRSRVIRRPDGQWVDAKLARAEDATPPENN